MVAPAIASAKSKATKAGIANVIRSGIGLPLFSPHPSSRKDSSRLGVYTRAERRAHVNGVRFARIRCAGGRTFVQRDSAISCSGKAVYRRLQKARERKARRPGTTKSRWLRRAQGRPFSS